MLIDSNSLPLSLEGSSLHASSDRLSFPFT